MGKMSPWNVQETRLKDRGIVWNKQKKGFFKGGSEFFDGRERGPAERVFLRRRKPLKTKGAGRLPFEKLHRRNKRLNECFAHVACDAIR